MQAEPAIRGIFGGRPGKFWSFINPQIFRFWSSKGTKKGQKNFAAPLAPRKTPFNPVFFAFYRVFGPYFDRKNHSQKFRFSKNFDIFLKVLESP